MRLGSVRLSSWSILFLLIAVALLSVPSRVLWERGTEFFSYVRHPGAYSLKDCSLQVPYGWPVSGYTDSSVVLGKQGKGYFLSTMVSIVNSQYMDRAKALADTVLLWDSLSTNRADWLHMVVADDRFDLLEEIYFMREKGLLISTHYVPDKFDPSLSEMVKTEIVDRIVCNP